MNTHKADVCHIDVGKKRLQMPCCASGEKLAEACTAGLVVSFCLVDFADASGYWAWFGFISSSFLERTGMVLAQNVKPLICGPLGYNFFFFSLLNCILPCDFVTLRCVQKHAFTLFLVCLCAVSVYNLRLLTVCVSCKSIWEPCRSSQFDIYYVPTVCFCLCGTFFAGSSLHCFSENCFTFIWMFFSLCWVLLDSLFLEDFLCFVKLAVFSYLLASVVYTTFVSVSTIFALNSFMICACYSS